MKLGLKTELCILHVSAPKPKQRCKKALVIWKYCATALHVFSCDSHCRWLVNESIHLAVEQLPCELWVCSAGLQVLCVNQCVHIAGDISTYIMSRTVTVFKSLSWLLHTPCQQTLLSCRRGSRSLNQGPCLNQGPLSQPPTLELVLQFSPFQVLLLFVI